jgi:hypothetical protein
MGPTVAGVGSAMVARALLTIAVLGMGFQSAGAESIGRPLECRHLSILYDEWRKIGSAIEAATQKRFDRKVACPLFREHFDAEAKILQALDANGAPCGVSPTVNRRIRGTRVRAQQTGKKICGDDWERPFRHDAPTIDDDELRPFRLHRDRRPGP